MLIGKRVFKVADGIQFLSSKLCKCVSKLNIGAKKVFVTTMGVGTELFKPRDVNKSIRSDAIKIGKIYNE